MIVAIEDDVVPEGLQREMILAADDRTEVRHQADKEGEEVEGGEDGGTGEEEIPLRGVLAAFVPAMMTSRVS